MPIQSRPAIRGVLLIATMLLLPLFTDPSVQAQEPAPDPVQELERLARSDRVETIRIGESPGGRPISMARISGRGAEGARPALLVVAGARSAHRIGTAVALALIERLSEDYGRDSAVTALLDRSTVLVLPLLSPDAAVASTRSPIQEQTRNESPFDDDRDGMVDEDGPDDLNGDGLITMMRIADPTGEWTEDADDPGLMRIADPARGERRAWRMLPEGVDDDEDGRWNEDPPGGVDIGLNFSRDYPWFAVGAGDHAISAPEARALAELLANREDIAIVVVLGQQDNLVSSWKLKPDGGEATTGQGPGRRMRQPLKTVLEDDAPWFAEISRRYLDATGRSGTDTLGIVPPGGDPLSWAYFHMGRWAFGSSVWTPPAVPEQEPESDEPDGAGAPVEGAAAAGADSAEAGSGTGPGDREQDPAAAERRLLRWIRANRPADFVDWTPITHPDFPDRVVEVGGVAPFARWTPPAALRDSLIEGEVQFLAELASLLPRVAIIEALSRPLGDDTYRVTAQIANEGFLPTHTALAERLRRPRAIRVEIETDGQEIAGGRRIQIIEALPGSGAATELTWTVVGRGSGKLTIRAGTPSAGEDRREVELR
jgi:hypothetical protein